MDPDRRKLRKSKSKLKLSFSRDLKSHKSTLGSLSGQDEVQTPIHASNIRKIQEEAQEKEDEQLSPF